MLAEFSSFVALLSQQEEPSVGCSQQGSAAVSVSFPAVVVVEVPQHASLLDVIV